MDGIATGWVGQPADTRWTPIQDSIPSNSPKAGLEHPGPEQRDHRRRDQERGEERQPPQHWAGASWLASSAMANPSTTSTGVLSNVNHAVCHSDSPHRGISQRLAEVAQPDESAGRAGEAVVGQAHLDAEHSGQTRNAA